MKDEKGPETTILHPRILSPTNTRLWYAIDRTVVPMLVNYLAVSLVRGL